MSTRRPTAPRKPRAPGAGWSRRSRGSWFERVKRERHRDWSPRTARTRWRRGESGPTGLLFRAEGEEFVPGGRAFLVGLGPPARGRSRVALFRDLPLVDVPGDPFLGTVVPDRALHLVSREDHL